MKAASKKTRRWPPAPVLATLLALLALGQGCFGFHGAPEWEQVSSADGRDERAGLPPDGYVDRVEDGFAVIVTEEDRVVHWPADGLSEGDVLRDGRPDPAASRALRARVEELRSRLAAGDEPEKELEL